MTNCQSACLVKSRWGHVYQTNNKINKIKNILKAHPTKEKTPKVIEGSTFSKRVFDDARRRSVQIRVNIKVTLPKVSAVQHLQTKARLQQSTDHIFQSHKHTTTNEKERVTSFCCASLPARTKKLSVEMNQSNFSNHRACLSWCTRFWTVIWELEKNWKRGGPKYALRRFDWIRTQGFPASLQRSYNLTNPRSHVQQPTFNHFLDVFNVPNKAYVTLGVASYLSELTSGSSLSSNQSALYCNFGLFLLLCCLLHHLIVFSCIGKSRKRDINIHLARHWKLK